MDKIKRRFLAAVAVLGLAAIFASVNISLSTAQEPKVPDLSDLRDAVKAANKRGENVSEIVTALATLEKSVAKGWTFPMGGRTVPASPELVALRDAVDAAARKGENVEAITKELEMVEKAMTGQALTRPKPQPPVDPPIRPQPFEQQFIRPGLRLGGNINPADLQKARELQLKALEMLAKNQNDAEAMMLLKDAQLLMLRVMQGGGLGGLDLDLNPGIDRLPNRFRLGIRMERLTPIMIEQLGIENGHGIAIAEVIEGSVAAKVGFKTHDIVLEFGGKAVTDAPEDFSRRVNEVKAGEKVDAVVLRKGKKVELKGIELPELPQIAPRLPNIQPRIPEFKAVPRVNVLPDLNDDIQPKVRKPGKGLRDPAINGSFAIKSVQNGVVYQITGTKGDAGPVITGVTIEDGGNVHKADSLEKLPAEYRPTVEKLVNGMQDRAAVRD
ncbi:MAG: PDZ domain-containing protein [Planctomycetes bacterium]|nr:PDZ domain-containing protein [Planctomycetota bacterium]